MYTWFLSALLAFSLHEVGAAPNLIELVETLERSGFPVLWEQPPQWGAYGLLEVEKRSIWIHPVVFELGIAQPTVVHEAVHAAQFCAAESLDDAPPQSIMDLSPLGLGLTPSPLVRPYILRYSDSKRRQLELEAYALQAEENGVDRAIVLLESYCGPTHDP